MANRLFNILATVATLVVASLALAPAPALADTTYDTVSSGNIKVKVPTEVPTYVCADGSVLAGDASITNEGTGDVIISDVSGTSDYSDFTLKVSTGSGDPGTEWFSFSNGKFKKPDTTTTLGAGKSLETKWNVGNLDATKNSDILAAATTKVGAKLATVTYTFKEPAKKDFAVFSADDSTLRFYHRASYPNIDETFEGHIVTNLFKDLKRSGAVGFWGAPFHDVAYSVKKAVIVDYGVKPSWMSSWFYMMPELESVENLDKIDASDLSRVDNLFYECKKLTKIDGLSKLDTSNVTSMDSMFYGCTGLTSLDVSNFDTSKVTSMGYMFYGCTGLTSLDLTKFNTSNVTSMGYMFYGCTGLTSLDVSNFDTSKVTSMDSMFEYCNSLSVIKVGDKWDRTSFSGLSGTWYDEDGKAYNVASEIAPKVARTYHKTNPKPQAAVSEVPVVTEDETAPADSQLAASVDLSTPTVLDTQQQGETAESDTTQGPETFSSDSTTESSQGDAVTEEASLLELPAAA